MRFLTVGLFVLIGLSLLGAQTADYILVNGKIVTVDNEFQVAQALAIRGERILAVGTNEEVRACAYPLFHTDEIMSNSGSHEASPHFSPGVTGGGDFSFWKGFLR